MYGTTKEKNLKTWIKFAVVLFQVLKLIGVSGQHGCQAHPPSENRSGHRGHRGFWLFGYQRGQTCLQGATRVVLQLGTSLRKPENDANIQLENSEIHPSSHQISLVN